MRILSRYALFLMLTANIALAFNGDRVTEGPLTVSIDPIPTISQYEKEIPVHVQFINSADTDLIVHVQINRLVDEMKIAGQGNKTIQVPASGKADCTFKVICEQGTCSAFYPVHIEADFLLDNTKHNAHAVQIVQTDFTQWLQKTSSRQLSLTAAPSQGAVDLLTADKQVHWKYFDGQEQTMPFGWSGSDQQSGTYVAAQNIMRGELRPSFSIHPPWRPRAGTVYVEYYLKLPDVKPITLTFANAIRDHSEKEPSSDGVTFRVWADGDKLYDRHTDAKTWQEGQVDLSPYAGCQIHLRLESHPGPKRDTTCDSSYWAQPMIIAGALPVFNTPERWESQRKRAERLITGNIPAKPDVHVFMLDGEYKVAVVLGQNGLLDASIAMGQNDKTVIFDGFDLSIMKQPLGKSFSGATVEGFEINKNSDRSIQVLHQLSVNGKKTFLNVQLIPCQTGLKVSFECPERITDLSLGAANQLADRIYYGHGYCIENPRPFQAGFGGHNLSTSHVGFDFASGISLVTASDNPPDRLVVNPDKRIYALHTHMNATLTLVPSVNGAFDAALRYRPLYDKKPSAGFARKAGRFVFDIWGGPYADNARIMQQLINYGLTDSLLTLHVWQRWGYDYRLPDIYPPNPDLGSLEDLQGLSALCRDHDIPWGLHDNYIDFYPDADDYSYNDIAFTENGDPIRAWLNESRDAQSYRWRPDCIMPFVQRNLKLIKTNLHPTHYFIDVFTSIECFDFYDRSGKFHSSLETRRRWGEAFQWIRNELGGQAPMTSEAGHDQLTGYIEGADCQFLCLTDTPKQFMIHLPCDDWERVPWYDAVLHDKFSLHGVGYSGRYQGGRDRQVHGIESDDYISAEILTGHALMMDREAFLQGSVRKYYLAQDFIRSIANDTIQSVQFVDGDIHRQVIRWNSGARVYVNRSEADWHVAGKTLPQYGYYAQNGKIQSSIEKIDNIVVEQAANDNSFFVNARGYGDKKQLEITPRINQFEYLGNNQFKLIIDWQAERPGPKDARIFVHFVRKDLKDYDDIIFQGDFTSEVSIDKWQNHVLTGQQRVINIPKNAPFGEYDIMVGIWSPKNGGRYRLRGDNDGSNRYMIGKLIIERDQQAVTNVKLTPHQPEDLSPGWGNLARTPIDFGSVKTTGAFHCEVMPGKVKIIPLPDLDPFEIKLNPEQINGKQAHLIALYAINETGKHTQNIKYVYDGQWLTFQTQQDVFGYELVYE